MAFPFSAQLAFPQPDVKINSVKSALVSVLCGCMTWCALSECGEPGAGARDDGKAPPAEIVNPEPFDPIRPKIAEVIQRDADTADVSASLPLAIIAADGEAGPGSWMLLDGSSSRNPGKRALEFYWQQSGGPALGLSADALRQPKVWLFLAAEGEYRMTLRVKNELGWSVPREVKFTVRPGRGAVPAEQARQLVGAGERVSFPGQGWRQVAGPPVELRYSDGAAWFRPGRSGFYLFEAMRAGDIPERRAAIVPPGRDTLLGDRRPIAKSAKNVTGVAGKPLRMSGTLSFDPDPEETEQLVAIWSTTEKQRGAEIVARPGMRAEFKAPRAGTYSAQLVVSDGRLESAPELIYIKLEDASARETAVLPDGGLGEELGEEREDMRQRRVTLGLWANLDRAVQLFPSRCDVTLRVDPDVSTPENFQRIPLALEVRDGALGHLVDWIARQTDSCYHREDERSIWLTRPLTWARTEHLEATAVLVDALYDPKKNGADLIALMMPSFQQIVAARDGAVFEFEPQRQVIHGVLPASACNRLREIIANLREASGLDLPPLDPLLPSELRIRKLLAEKRVTFKKSEQRLDHLLRDLAIESGVPMAMDSRQFPGAMPRISVDIENAPLRDALRTIVDAAGFDGCSVERPAGIWFYRGQAPYPSGELLWDHTVVRCYDLARLLPQIEPITGEMIAHTIRQRIYPPSWKDPGALVFFHGQTRKLIVMHGPQAQHKVLEFLHDLRARGMWSLGPVE